MSQVSLYLSTSEADRKKRRKERRWGKEREEGRKWGEEGMKADRQVEREGRRHEGKRKMIINFDCIFVKEFREC